MDNKTFELIDGTTTKVMEVYDFNEKISAMVDLIHNMCEEFDDQTEHKEQVFHAMYNMPHIKMANSIINDYTIMISERINEIDKCIDKIFDLVREKEKNENEREEK